MRIRHTFLGVALALFALQGVARDGTEIHADEGESVEAGFVDIDLHIDSLNCDSWSDCTASASGTFHGRPVAVDISIHTRDGQGRITYRSVGPASDALLQSLATLYKMPRDGAAFATSAAADIVFLDADAHEMAGKVFFAANGPESDYAELYTNIDKTRRVVEIHEKDPEYRAKVLKALSR